MYGHEYVQTRYDFGLISTLPRQQSKTVSELSSLTAVHTAKGIAKQEGTTEIFVCTATTVCRFIGHIPFSGRPPCCGSRLVESARALGLDAVASLERGAEMNQKKLRVSGIDGA